MGETPPSIVRHVVRMMEDEMASHLVGVLWTGSRAYGESWPNSDWDFFVIHDRPWRQRRLLQAGGQAIELFINPIDQILREFQDEESATIGMFARGQVVWDRDETTHQLKVQAGRLAQHSPRDWSPIERDQWRYDTMDLMNDAEDLLAADPDAASYLMGLAMQRLLEGWYRMHGFWEPKAKYVMADLARLDPAIAFQCRIVISHHQPVTRRFEALKELVETLHKPLGGALKTWQTAPEAVHPLQETDRAGEREA